MGTPVSVYDSLIEGGAGTKGVAVEDGTPGELVAHASFPNMPVYFWGDTLPPSTSSKYFTSYFEKYDNVWTHGDFVMIHPETKNLVFLGRADGVLKYVSWSLFASGVIADFSLQSFGGAFWQC